MLVKLIFYQETSISHNTIYRNVVLPANVCKATSHFKEKVCNLACQCFLNVKLILECHCAQKTKIVWVFKNILRQIGLKRWLGLLKVIDCMPFSMDISICYLHKHHITTPSILRSFCDVISSFGNVFYFR